MQDVAFVMQTARRTSNEDILKKENGDLNLRASTPTSHVVCSPLLQNMTLGRTKKNQECLKVQESRQLLIHDDVGVPAFKVRRLKKAELSVAEKQQMLRTCKCVRSHLARRRQDAHRR
jgi:hypothetical protein